MSKHTPAPWAVGTLGNDIGVLAASDEPFCRLFTSEETYDEALANARLIAAAPDLLSALKEALYAVTEIDNAHKSLRRIRAAIAKAEGR